MAKTFMDELVEYPARALHTIGTDETVAKLITNNPSIVIGSDEADAIFDKNLFDYAYVDSTNHETAAFIFAEAEVPLVANATVKQMKLYINVVCHKQYMKLDPALFPGVVGNRRDNLVRQIDKLLNQSDMFGIGRLSLFSVRTIAGPFDFSVREITYVTPEFNIKGIT